MDTHDETVRLIGDPVLRQRSAPVGDPHAPDHVRDADRLKRALQAFRAQHGFGRAIAAPQLGMSRRFIALNLGDGPFVIANPEITWRSDETFTLWDDCMSFPFLLVKVRRHDSITVRYTDEEGKEQEWSELGRATSELLQHEIDHLDGVLAVDRALDRDSLVSRVVFEARLDDFRAQVDYTIGD